MKKMLISLLLVLIFNFAAYGAASDDVYLRRDVFEAKMDALMAEIRLGNEQLRNELRSEIQSVKTELHSEIQEVKNELQTEIQGLSSKIDVLDERTRGTERTVYWGLAFFGIFIVLVSFAPGIAEFIKTLRKPQLTIEDVEKIFDKKFEILNAKLAAK